jgi:hypothetical protein
MGGGAHHRFGQSQAKLEDLWMVGISHLHPDHVSDLPALLWLSNQVRKEPLPMNRFGIPRLVSSSFALSLLVLAAPARGQDNGPPQDLGSSEAVYLAKGVFHRAILPSDSPVITDLMIRNAIVWAEDYGSFTLLYVDARRGGQSRTTDPAERMQQRAMAMAETSSALKKLADATGPLYTSLDDNQKRRFGILSRLGVDGNGGRANPHRMMHDGPRGFRRTDGSGIENGPAQGAPSRLFLAPARGEEQL